MLTKIRLSNFKTFKDTIFELAPLTLIYGANAVGKSNFFDALRFLKAIGQGTSIRDAIEGHSALGSPHLAIPGLRGGSKELTTFGSKSNLFRIDATLARGKRSFRYTIEVNAETYKVVREELVAPTHMHPGPYVFSTHPEAAPLEQALDSPALIARFYKATPGRNPRRSFSAYESILSQFKGRKAETVLNENAAEEVRTELASITPLELRPEVLRQYASLGRFELGEHGENFAAVVWMLLQYAQHYDPSKENGDGLLKEANERLQAITSWLAQLAPRPVHELLTESAPTGEVIFSVREGQNEKPISARSLSDGTLRFAALAFALFGSPGERGRILAVEELENGINPARFSLLLRMIEAATQEDTGTQVLATTHAANILDLATPDIIKNMLIVGWDAEREASRVVPLATLPEFDAVRKETNLSELLSEGWLQFAADA
ncbi:MAG TPA: AAA family ATPase [Actinomycetes bacterium]|nr:AAA family ATPase [Actinomycetes bacterium]